MAAVLARTGWLLRQPYDPTAFWSRTAWPAFDIAHPRPDLAGAALDPHRETAPVVLAQGEGGRTMRRVVEAQARRVIYAEARRATDTAATRRCAARTTPRRAGATRPQGTARRNSRRVRSTPNSSDWTCQIKLVDGQMN